MKKTEIIILAIILISFMLGFYFYPKMPDQMASHWDMQSKVNGYMPKLWGLFLMPLISIALFFLFIAIPKIDPLKENIKKFRKYFDVFIALVMVFLFYIYLLTILWNLGLRFNMAQLLVPALGILFYYCGVLMENAKRNWFIGIRTPWTLSSEKVWEKTHKIGGKLFKASGIIAFLGMVFPNFALFFILFPVIAASIYATIYSYFEYRREIK